MTVVHLAGCTVYALLIGSPMLVRLVEVLLPWTSRQRTAL